MKPATLTQGPPSRILMAMTLSFALGGGKPIARIFDHHETVVTIVALYLIIVPLSYPARRMMIVITSSLNALAKPFPATALAIFRTFILYIPLAYLGQAHLGIVGIFSAALVANIVSGLIALGWEQKFLRPQTT